MDLNLFNKNALVGGSSKGIGFAAAAELALLGANVTLMARNEATLHAAKQMLDVSKGQQHDFLVADVSDLTNLGQKISALVATKTIHILVKNTGGPPSGAIADATMLEFSTAFQNHLLANHLLATSVVAGMKQAQFGRIINIISTSVKQPLDGLGVSNTIRAAVANWSKTLANELAPFAITVNNVLPGATQTERLEAIIELKAQKQYLSAAVVAAEMRAEIPMRRFATATEVAAAVAFLASPSAAYITGINLPVDGGRLKSL